MNIIIIVARDRKGGIGSHDALPWKMSDDLVSFRMRTMGHHVVMGRKTYESIGRPLPGRFMVVVSRRRDLEIEGCDVVPSLTEAYALARRRNEDRCYVIGGGEIYAQALPDADTLVVTEVDATVDADTFFPDIDEAAWHEVARVPIERNEKNQYDAVIRELVRR
ncbi:MAG: dihydrofolate reductase [Candidatus Kapaibacterium sp.]